MTILQTIKFTAKGYRATRLVVMRKVIKRRACLSFNFKSMRVSWSLAPISVVLMPALDFPPTSTTCT